MDSTNPPIDPIQAAKAIIEETSVNLFLTGKAGTGKTTFLRSLSQSTSKRHVVLAPTGVAAINAQGSTIHSFFQLSFSPFIPGVGYAGGNERYNRFRKDKLKLIRSLDLIIIDEISMVRPDVLDAVDTTLRRMRNPLKPFGGVQLLLIGDLRQLAPVAQEQEWSMLKDHYASPYFFESHALKEAGFLMVELTKVYRQDDPVFIDILNKIRDNRADASTLEKLNRRANPALMSGMEDDYIRLTTHNHSASLINADRLSRIKSPAMTFTASVSGDFPESAYPAEPLLTLKVGAKVMFIRNDSQRGYYNGLIGVVTDLSENKVRVRTDSADPSSPGTIEVEYAEWERTKYTLTKEGEIREEIEGVFSQIPLRLAWSITIHKSQGLTFDKAVVDASHSFAPGQTYVALSRCRSLDGLVLDSPLPMSAIITDPTVNNFISHQPRMQGSDEELAQFRESYYSEMLAELFDFRTIDKAVDDYYRAAAAVLGRDYPKFVDSVSDMLHDFQCKVTDVCSTLYSYLRCTLPLRHTDPSKSAELSKKIAGGARYFISQLDSCRRLVADTPVNVDNKALKLRLTDQQQALLELLEMKIKVLDAFTDTDFDPSAYLRRKTEILLKSAAPLRAGKSSVGSRSSSGGAGTDPTHPASQTGSRTTPSDIDNPKLYNLIIEWRRQRAEADGIPPFTILHNRTAIEISSVMPRDTGMLRQIHGIGKNKLSLYGDDILRIVTSYIKDYADQ